MFNVCPTCGEYRVDKIIQHTQDRTYAICPECNHPHPFLQLPLFIVTGASGSGKSTLVLELSSMTKDVVVMETDILWDDRYNQPETNYRNYREMWLRMAKNIAQAGKPVVLCGTTVPEQLEDCEERRYFGETHYIALVCESSLLEERLKRRPTWRASGSDDFIKGMVGFNRWLIEQGPTCNPEIAALDTSQDTPHETAIKLLAMIRQAAGIQPQP
ncbi:AAA family ATPase [Paenibacillus montanisoli]|uniref:Nucleoside kinase n=1 Tax=Paenibacillus montanisoli TaxID=2081970 RepID=A0A328U8F3_9BACL|nr:AAA family ATPase [Paenibacillus montanisoli]RAP77235.1 nucleoside kinase [Paenibacillus montanisoli]